MRYFDPNIADPSGATGASLTPTGTAGAPPVSPAAPPPTTVQTMAGFTPDYTKLIQSDPTYVAAQNATTQSQAAAEARRRAAIRSAFVQYGGDLPPGFTDQYGDIDQTTRDAAAGNQQSVFAQLADRYKQGVENFRRGLASRGMLQSSELDYGQDQLNRGQAQQRYDAGNAFLNQVNQGYGDYAGVLGANAQNMVGAIGTAEANVYANDAYRPTAATYADYDPTSSARYGKAVYTGSDGKLYDANGNPFAPPVSPSPTTNDWRMETGTDSTYSPGVASSDLAYLYGGA